MRIARKPKNYIKMEISLLLLWRELTVCAVFRISDLKVWRASVNKSKKKTCIIIQFIVKGKSRKRIFISLFTYICTSIMVNNVNHIKLLPLRMWCKE